MGTAARPMKQVTVLLVDDNEDHRFLTQRALGSLKGEYDVRVLVARDGEEALDWAWGRRGRDAPPVDLVLLDIKMPRLTGFDVLRSLREDPRTARLRVVMLTSSENGQDVERARALGADDYVTKPMDPAAFRAAVADLLRRHAPGG